MLLVVGVPSARSVDIRLSHFYIPSGIQPIENADITFRSVLGITIRTWFRHGEHRRLWLDRSFANTSPQHEHGFSTSTSGFGFHGVFLAHFHLH